MQQYPIKLEDQLKAFKDKGIQIDAEPQDQTFLSTISYFRLIVYLNSSKGNITKLSELIELYEFDRKLRLLIFDAVERIEVCIRKQFCDCIVNNFGPLGYRNPDHFHCSFVQTPTNDQNWKNINYKKWLCSIEKEFSRSEKSKNRTDFSCVPICEITETMSFGFLSRGCYGLKKDQQLQITTWFEIDKGKIDHWFRILTNSRNICSHHAILWDKDFNFKSKKLGHHKGINGLIILISHLLKKDKNYSNWKKEMEQLVIPIVKKRAWLQEIMRIPNQLNESDYW